MHERGRWPGIELYYPPIKFVPKRGAYEEIEEAESRFWRWGATTEAHTIIFDLEDGCQRKAESRALLRKVLPKLDRPDLMVALRINQFRTSEYERDLELVSDLKDHIQVVILAKAGEEYGAAEIRELSSWIVKINAPLAVEPIIEHPKSLKIAEQILGYDSVCHVVFGIHDFSKAMGVHITPRHWLEELRVWRDMLLLEARLHGKGVIGGVDPLVGQKLMPSDLTEDAEVRRWLETEGDEQARVVYEHAKAEAQFGLTGKQVVHPYHIPLCKAAFVPAPDQVQDQMDILRKAMEAKALIGGAILHKGEMLDPPMFGKALQTLLRAAALGALDAEATALAQSVVDAMPDFALRENWPYNVIL
ncbi:MAG: aldolase [Deltaproteobacteria bacterium]|nr:aldolase [Deltaproteobacteria bacterium]